LRHLKNILSITGVIVTLLLFYQLFAWWQKQQVTVPTELIQQAETVMVPKASSAVLSLCEAGRAQMERDRPGYCTRHPEFKTCTCE
jgi:hypothetical protein